MYRSVGGVDPLSPGPSPQRGGVEGGRVPGAGAGGRPQRPRRRRRALGPRCRRGRQAGRSPDVGAPHDGAARAPRGSSAGSADARAGSWRSGQGGRRRPGGHGFDTTGFRALAAPPGRFYADPFVVARPDGGAYVFVEDGPLDGGPARISVLTLDPDGTQQAPGRAVLERKTHLSYPFVFEDKGSWYMLPETAGTGTDRAAARAGVPMAVGALRDARGRRAGLGPDAAAARRPLLVVRGRGCPRRQALRRALPLLRTGPPRPRGDRIRATRSSPTSRRARPAGRVLEIDGSPDPSRPGRSGRLRSPHRPEPDRRPDSRRLRGDARWRRSSRAGYRVWSARTPTQPTVGSRRWTACAT